MIPEEYVTDKTSHMIYKAGYPKEENFVQSYVRSMIENETNKKRDWLFKPSQSQAMRWLREEKNINIRINYHSELKKWFFDMLNLDDAIDNVESNKDFDPYGYYECDNPFAIYGYLESEEYFPTYEAAAEAGIQAACMYLIEKGGEG